MPPSDSTHTPARYVNKPESEDRGERSGNRRRSKYLCDVSSNSQQHVCTRNVRALMEMRSDCSHRAAAVCKRASGKDIPDVQTEEQTGRRIICECFFSEYV